jgi:hypothetical protein
VERERDVAHEVGALGVELRAVRGRVGARAGLREGLHELLLLRREGLHVFASSGKLTAQLLDRAERVVSRIAGHLGVQVLRGQRLLVLLQALGLGARCRIDALELALELIGARLRLAVCRTLRLERGAHFFVAARGYAPGEQRQREA